MLYKSILFGHVITFKLPLRIFALIGIAFLGGVAAAFTYQSAGEILQFLSSAKISSTLVAKYFLHTMAIVVGLATVLQSFEMIWDKMSYWGQKIDNIILKLVTKKKYFLDEIEACLYKVRKLLNDTSCAFHQLNWQLTRKNNSNKDIAQSVLDSLLNKDIAKIFELLEKNLELLRHNHIHDNTNERRKYEADIAVNQLIAQTSDLSVQVTDLITQLKEDRQVKISQ